MPSGDQKVTVITAAGVESEGFPVTVVAGLRIVGLSAATVKPNDEVRILVEGLPADAKQDDVTVLVGGVAAAPKLADDKRSLSIRIPEGLEPGEPNILVRYAGEASNEKPVKLPTTTPT
jgi:hypothetical protein